MNEPSQSAEQGDGAEAINVIFAEFLGINNLLFNPRIKKWLPVPKSVRAMRYAAHAAMLDNLVLRLQTVIEGLRVDLRRERAMLRYAGMLLDAIQCLSRICKRLGERPRRPKGEYGEEQYQQDLKEYQLLVENYRVESAKINRFLARTPR